jgi:hypothetical protein
MKRKPNRKPSRSLITSHLRGIKRALLDGEKRPAFLEFLNQSRDRRGVYALYDKRGRLYYAGKASDLPKRLDQHLGDRHAEGWDQMSLFFVTGSANVPELEGLIVATAKPPENKQKPKIGRDLRRDLRRYLRHDAVLQIDQAIYPGHRQKPDILSGRITPKRLKNLSQAKLATALGISQGYVSHLINEDKKNLRTLRRYIRDAGRRDGVLLLLQKTKEPK